MFIHRFDDGAYLVYNYKSKGYFVVAAILTRDRGVVTGELFLEGAAEPDRARFNQLVESEAKFHSL